MLKNNSGQIIYGKHPVLEALSVGKGLVRWVILAKGVQQDKAIAEISRRAADCRIRVETIDRKQLSSLAGTTKHQGILAGVKTRTPQNIDDILRIARQRKEEPFLLLLDGIEDPHNLGSILRSAEGFGVHGVIIGKHRQVELTPTVWKSSAGAAAHIPVAVVTNLASAVDYLKKKWSIICVGLEEGGLKSCKESDFNRGLLLVVGGEGKGIRPVLRKRCDMTLRIPIKGKISSYNASVATAVVLFEVMCQREGKNQEKLVEAGRKREQTLVDVKKQE